MKNTRVVREACKAVLGMDRVQYVDTRKHDMLAMKMWGHITDEQAAQIVGYCKERGVTVKVKLGTARWFHSCCSHRDEYYAPGEGTPWTRFFVPKGEVGA